MVVFISGYLFLIIGLLILALPLILVELSRPKDWLMGGIFLFLGVYLQVEKEILIGSINLLVVSMAILYVIMILEIFQTRWYQLSPDEKKLIGSFKRWLESYKQLSQIFSLLANGFLNFFKSLITKSDKPKKEKKWVHPELKEEEKNKLFETSGSIDSNKIRNQELTENEETS